MLKFPLLAVLFIAAFGCQQIASTEPDPTPAKLYFPPVGTLITDWATATPESLGWKTANIQPLYDYLRQTNTRAFLVLKDGRIVLEAYFGQNITNTGDFDRGSYWQWASAGKTLVSFLVGKAQEEKRLSIDQPTSTYLGTGWTSLPTAKERLITVRHQLTMTTGLDDGVANPDDIRPASLIYKADAGTRWSYHNAPYTLLGEVISKATGQTFDAYFDSRLKTKIGMDGLWRQFGDNNMFLSTARSMARFGLLIQNRGNWDGQPILADDAYLTASLTTSQQLNLSYGYLWWLNGKASVMVPFSQTVFPTMLTPSAPVDLVAAMGKNGQLLNIVPSKGLIMVRMGDSPDNTAVPFNYQTEIWKRLSLIIP
jgi:CubicO group peptidase (beta-lactamase class C family)